MPDMSYNRQPDPCGNVRYDHCHDQENKPCKDLDTRVEFRYDERTPAEPISIPTTTPGVELLEVRFDKVAAGNRVWLSGVILVDSNVNQIARLTIRIVKDSPNINPITIYTSIVEIDVSSADDLSAIPFSHVDVNNVNLFDVRYRVFASSNIPGLVSQGPNTLTALRFENK